MNSPATDLAAKLATAGVGTIGTNLFVQRMPDDPDTCVCLYDYEGSSIDTLCSFSLEDFRVQVIARANTYAVAWAKMLAVQAVLDYIARETIGGTYYHVAYRRSLPFSLGQDARDRAEISQNYAGIRQ